MRRARRDAVASDAVAEEAALALLADGASALSAALGGFFAAAGASAGVLLGPLGILLGGIGQGARAFDGRLRQPGLGARRPRGFQADETIPDAASIAVPVALHTAIVAHAYGSGASLNAILRPGIEAASARGAEKRARLLTRVAEVGASALAEPAFQRPLLYAGGASEGGLITPRDLEPKSDIDLPTSPLTSGEHNYLTAPWMKAAAPGTSEGRGRGLCVADAMGGLAALCYRDVDRGVALDELDLIAPLASVPVRRGVARVAPGAHLTAPFAAAIRLDSQMRPIEISLEPESADFDPEMAQNPRFTLLVDPESRSVSRR